MSFLLDKTSLIYLFAPHVIANTIKLFFLKKRSPLKWLMHVIYSATLTVLFLIITKKLFLHNIDKRNTKVLNQYHYSFLTASIFSSILFFNFRFYFSVEDFITWSKKRVILYVACFIIVVFSFTFNQLYKFSFESWGKVEFSQIMFNLMNPAKDEHAKGFFNRFLRNYFYPTFKDCIKTFVFAAIILPFRVSYEYDLNCFTDEDGPSIQISLYLFTALLFVVKLYYTVKDFEIFTSNDVLTTTLYEKNYINPANVHIQFPEEKRNLVYIYLESMENTFASIESGGAYKESLIPNLESLFKEPNNYHFSHSTKIGGYGNYPLMCWSAAGIFTSQSGIPLKPFYFPRLHSFPNIITMTDILSTNGYSTHLASSTPYQSWGTSLVFNTHNTEIHSPAEIFAENPKYWKIKRDKNTLYDSTIFEYAKDKIQEILKDGDKPFFMAVDTIETHFPDGMTCPLCSKSYPQLRHFNKVRRCADKLTYDFIRWIQQQPFANKTTIFVTGDHLCMGDDLYKTKEVSNKYKRTVFNLIINSAIHPDKNATQNRNFAPFDWYPTILAAIGAKIPGERLALGTNLYSGMKTLAERVPDFYKEITKFSKFYSRVLAGDQSEPLMRIVPQWMPAKDLNELYKDIKPVKSDKKS